MELAGSCVVSAGTGGRRLGSGRPASGEGQLVVALALAERANNYSTNTATYPGWESRRRCCPRGVNGRRGREVFVRVVFLSSETRGS